MTMIVFGPGFKSGRKLRTTRTVLQVAGGASPRRSPYTSGRLLHSHPDLLPVGNGLKVFVLTQHKELQDFSANHRNGY